MSVKILVDLRTIKKNPEAGKTHFLVEGRRDFYGKYKGAQLPKDMEPFCFVTYQEFNTNGAFTEFHSKGQADMDVLKGHEKDIEGLTFTHTPHEINTRPQPKYLYDYEKTKLECSNCGSKVRHDHIESDWAFDGEDEVYTEWCPICKEVGTFPAREYESITEALKRGARGG